MFNATTQICLRGNGSSACGGDSGGPLLIRRLIKGGSGGGGWRWEQIGVANSGNEGCTTPSKF
jgi:secreted trypsin-like serine protease